MDSQEVIFTLLPYLDELRKGIAESAFCDEREDAEWCARRVALLRFDGGIEEFAIHAKVWMEGISLNVVATGDTSIGADIRGESDGHGEVGLGPATIFDWGPEIRNCLVYRVFANIAFVVEIRIGTQEEPLAVDWRAAQIGDGLELP